MRAFLAALFLLGGVLAPAARAASPVAPPAPLVIYTATSATTAQAPLWGAIADGWAAGRTLDVRYWKDLDDLRGIILAGKGDLWVGHLDGFAQAARRGAPVVLAAVTAWSQKFRFLTLEAGVKTAAALAAHMDKTGEALAVIPQGSPAHAFLQAEGMGGKTVRIQPMSPQQAGLSLARGAVRHLMVPEPLASALIAKFPALHRAGSLADLTPGEPAGLPMAGVAVRSGLLAEDPGLVSGLTAKMRAWAERHHGDPAAILAALPAGTRAAVGEKVLAESLRFDPLLVVTAADARAAIRRALAVTDGPHPVPDAFFAPAAP
ncbi:MAG: hypothetical protein AB7D00_07905 [Rhodospirillaceae bacterium]